MPKLLLMALYVKERPCGHSRVPCGHSRLHSRAAALGKEGPQRRARSARHRRSTNRVARASAGAGRLRDLRPRGPIHPLSVAAAGVPPSGRGPHNTAERILGPAFLIISMVCDSEMLPNIMRFIARRFHHHPFSWQAPRIRVIPRRAALAARLGGTPAHGGGLGRIYHDSHGRL